MSSLSPHLEINLRQIQRNYKAAGAMAGKVEVSAVLKANAYGLGAPPIAKALFEVGCRTFWVARTSEAIALRAILPKADIYAMNGPEKELLDVYRKMKLRPVINTLHQLKIWSAYALKHKVEPVALHVETGFNRLALQEQDLKFAQKAWKNNAFSVALIMSHLACVDTPSHPKNLEQFKRFEAVKNLFPGVRASLSASYAILEKDKNFRQNMLRVGKILYGIRDPKDGTFITKPVIRLSAPVIQVMTVKKGASVGYDGTWKASKTRKLATLAIGYADGIPRSMQKNGEIYFTKHGRTYIAPLAGRVSMDLLTCDVTDIPADCVCEGATAFIINKEHDIMRYSDTCGIMGYEAMTHFNERIERVYIRK